MYVTRYGDTFCKVQGANTCFGYLQLQLYKLAVLSEHQYPGRSDVSGCSWGYIALGFRVYTP